MTTGKPSEMTGGLGISCCEFIAVCIWVLVVIFSFVRHRGRAEAGSPLAVGMLEPCDNMFLVIAQRIMIGYSWRDGPRGDM